MTSQDTTSSITIRGVTLDISEAGQEADGLWVCAAHPVDRFGLPTAQLLAEASQSRVICINPTSPDEGAVFLEEMVDRIEEIRQKRSLPPFLFWGMSGGGWLAQLYARRYPAALKGIVLESICLCYRERLADPECALSPFFPAWRAGLSEAGLLSESAHQQPTPAQDTEWVKVSGVGEVLRQKGGPALLVSPMELSPTLRSMIPVYWGFDARGWLRELRTPTLVLTGTADPILPVRQARAVHEAIEGSHFVTVEGAGHVPTSQKRSEVKSAFQEFLRTLS